MPGGSGDVIAARKPTGTITLTDDAREAGVSIDLIGGQLGPDSGQRGHRRCPGVHAAQVVEAEASIRQAMPARGNHCRDAVAAMLVTAGKERVAGVGMGLDAGASEWLGHGLAGLNGRTR